MSHSKYVMNSFHLMLLYTIMAHINFYNSVHYVCIFKIWQNQELRLPIILLIFTNLLELQLTNPACLTWPAVLSSSTANLNNSLFHLHQCQLCVSWLVWLNQICLYYQIYLPLLPSTRKMLCSHHRLNQIF